MTKKTGFIKSPYKNGEVKTGKKEKYLLLFITAFLGMMVSFLPSLIANKGVFLYYGDFNSQQQMFYYHAQDMVKSGNLGWDWGTDLGSSFVTSYSFYLIGSPFFWLTALFPKGATVYLLPWLLSLKTAVAAVTAYAYIRRFVQNKNACFIGGMLYAFSGFQSYNVFFNHFHDATAFFPLLLLGLELLVQDNKKGAFALAVALNAVVSYFFFISDCVFLVIYFLVRCSDKEFKITLKKFGLLALESVTGVMIAAFLFLPSCLAILNNYRVNERLYGLDMVLYSDHTRIARIIQSFFMMSDMPARINILNSDKARWASLAGYLPLFSMCGVIAFMRTKKKHWASLLTIVCTIFAFIPILNSSFVMFNASYYARWYYCPILIMCMMTAKIAAENVKLLKKGFAPVCIIGLAFLAVGLLPKKENGETVYLKVPKYIEFYYVQVGVTVLMIIALAVLIFVLAKRKKRTEIIQITSLMTTVSCVICMTASVLYGVTQGENNKNYISRAINGGENINMQKLEASSKNYDPDNSFYRIDTSPNVDNWCMFWGLSSMRCFHSVVSTSIMDFYTSIGQTRDVATRMEPNLYPLRSLLSAKYYFDAVSNNSTDSSGDALPGSEHKVMSDFKYVDTQNGFNIYENENYIPMGFAFDDYVLDKDIKELSSFNKTQALLKALVLTEEQGEKYSEYIDHTTLESSTYTDEAMRQDCLKRRENSCYSFKYDTNGFEGKIKLDDKKLVFFSVPYDKGWSAQVNGKDIPIIKVDYGFMAVPCEEGESTITFSYKTYGSGWGKALTAGGIVIFAVYMGIVWYYKKKRPTLSADNDENQEISEEENISENNNYENVQTENNSFKENE